MVSCIKKHQKDTKAFEIKNRLIKSKILIKYKNKHSTWYLLKQHEPVTRSNLDQNSTIQVATFQTKIGVKPSTTLIILSDPVNVKHTCIKFKNP